MANLDNYLVGTCKDMCPLEEITLREREKLLHILEILPGTEKDSKPKADKSRMVKTFCRSAAGKSMQDPRNLRPPNVLLKTLNYLLDEVVMRQDLPWTLIYDFVMDRLRSIRQDLVIQNAAKAYYIAILQPIVRFHAYASYRLCEENLNNFDPVINNTHLQECLKRLLCMYDCIDEQDKRGADFWESSSFLIENRPQFEALYLILNLGHSEAITRALNLPEIWRTSLLVTALQISLSFLSNNFVRTCRLIRQLPNLLLAVASLHLPKIRRSALKIMSVAYSSKNILFPIDVLKNLLLYNNYKEVLSDCKYYGIDIQKNGICFLKTSFHDDKKVFSGSIPPSALPTKTIYANTAATGGGANTNERMINLSPSVILNSLRAVREPILDYQEGRGVSRSESVSFLALITSLCTHAYTAAITILVMLWNLAPLLDGFVYFARFVLDKLIDIFETRDKKDKVFKAAVFGGEIIVILFIVFLIMGLIFMPVYVLTARIVSKIWGMIAW